MPKLLEQWTPLHAGIFSDLQRSASQSEAGISEEETLEAIKADPFLYCWLLTKNARSVTKKSYGASEPLGRQVVETLHWANDFNVSPRQLHSHSVASLIQQRATRKTLTRTAASDVLAPYFKVDSDAAYAVSALRELGHSLIVWNYPRIYAHAVEHVERQVPDQKERVRLLDQRLTKVLGFSPYTLSLAIAQHCQLSPEIQIGVGHSAERLSATPEIAAVGSTLAKVAQIADIFAQSTMPEAGEEVTTRWDRMRAELLPLLGASGLSMLNDACTLVLQRYADVLPELASHPITPPIKKAAPRPHTQLFIQNLYIPHCSIELKELLHVTYARLDPRIVSYETITELMQLVAPKAGFTDGAFYLLNPDLIQLEPRVKLGAKTDALVAIPYRDKRFSAHPVARTFLGKAPVIEGHSSPEKISFSGIIGSAQRVGVLYLEATMDQPNQNVRPRMHFKALQQTLTDCLNVL